MIRKPVDELRLFAKSTGRPTPSSSTRMVARPCSAAMLTRITPRCGWIGVLQAVGDKLVGNEPERQSAAVGHDEPGYRGGKLHLMLAGALLQAAGTGRRNSPQGPPFRRPPACELFVERCHRGNARRGIRQRAFRFGGTRRALLNGQHRGDEVEAVLDPVVQLAQQHLLALERLAQPGFLVEAPGDVQRFRAASPLSSPRRDPHTACARAPGST
jgi:hypothetical protein